MKKRKMLWLIPALLMVGCATTLSGVMNAISVWLPVGIQAVDSFVVIASPSNAKVAQDGAAIQKLFLDTQAAIASANGPSVLAKIQALTAAIPQWEQDISMLGANISPNDKAYIAAGAAVVMVALSAYQAELQAQLPPGTPVASLRDIAGYCYGFRAQGPVAALQTVAYIDCTGDPEDSVYYETVGQPQTTVTPSSKSVYVVPKAPTLTAWKLQFNAIARKYGHPEHQIKVTRKEKAVRYLTLGKK